jgi:hypothetical protein
MIVQEAKKFSEDFNETRKDLCKKVNGLYKKNDNKDYCLKELGAHLNLNVIPSCKIVVDI